ncbi:MAG: hypothetical protein WBE32_20370, partial [Pseudolabrys sp.]
AAPRHWCRAHLSPLRRLVHKQARLKLDPMKLPVPIRVDAGNFDSETRARSSGGTLRHQVVQQGAAP